MDKNFVKVDKWGECLWGIDETGRLFINGGQAESVDDSGIPWENYRTLITEAAVIGEVTFPQGASLAGLFKGCKGLEAADLSGFNTAEFDLVSGRYVIDAKSIMGIFSLDISKPIDLNIYAEDNMDEILDTLKPYLSE